MIAASETRAFDRGLRKSALVFACALVLISAGACEEVQDFGANDPGVDAPFSEVDATVAQQVDAAMPQDSTPVDVAMSPDVAMLPDVAVLPDIAMLPDVAQPPDLTMPDLAMPDLATFDLAKPDLTLCPMLGQLFCNNGCIDSMTDHENCGACGFSCNNYYCVNGLCTKCPNNMVGCKNNACVNTFGDPNHCGGCGKACPMNNSCLNAMCVPCTKTLCGNDCFDIMTNPMHCGACNISCVTDAGFGTCAGGTCI